MSAPPRPKLLLPALLLALCTLARPAHAYVDLAPTMAKLITDSKSVSLVEVVQFDRTTRTLILKEIQTYKGPKPTGNGGGAAASDTGEIRHIVAPSDTAIIPRPIMQWAQPGAQAVLFSSGRTALVCTGQAWYQENSSAKPGSPASIAPNSPSPTTAPSRASPTASAKCSPAAMRSSP